MATQPLPPAPSPGPRVFDVVATIVVAFNFAFAHPLLALVGDNPAFFVAHRSTGGDLLLLAAFLTLVVPLTGAAFVLLISRLHPAAGRMAWVIVLGGSFGLFAAQILRTAPIPGALSLLVAALIGIALGAGVSIATSLHRLARWLSPVALVVAGLFLFASPSKALLRNDAAPAGTARVTRPAPIVFLQFDEFPVASLMTLDGEIDEELFPNFAHLGTEGTWYRNATTVHDFTQYAIPAILSGKHTTKGQPPTAGSHPNTLFTLLDGTHDVHAVEPITELCPQDVCKVREPAPPLTIRWRGMLSDLRYITLHLELPRDLADGLPAIDETWANFGARAVRKAKGAGGINLRGRFNKAVRADRTVAFDDFISSIRRTAHPTLHFMHLLMPHNPLEYTPEGVSYTDETSLPGVGTKNMWADDDWLAALAYQRHLLQVRFTDRMVGQLIKHLKDLGVYDETMIVMTADHGAAFTAGTFRRTATRGTLGEIAAVPLFIKFPHQRSGGTNDAPIESVDILPTIAEALGVEGLWETDGVPAGDVTRSTKRLVTRTETIDFPTAGEEKMEIVRRKYELFARAGDSLDLWRLGPDAHLIGTRIGRVDTQPGATVDLQEPTSGGGVGLVRAKLHGVRAGTRIALATRGTIRSVARAHADDGGVAVAALLVPRTEPGPISLYVIEGSGRLRSIRVA